jgi:hypothetical protein
MMARRARVAWWSLDLTVPGGSPRTSAASGPEMIDRQPLERAVHLITVRQRPGLVRMTRLETRRERDDRPEAAMPSLAVAGPDEEPVEPGVERRRVSQLGQVPPRSQERLLDGVLGEVRPAEDALRDGVQPVDRGSRELVEGVPVAALRTNHEFRAQPSPPLACRSGRREA